MKRILCALLSCLFCLFLAGCHGHDSNTVPFYYSRDPVLYQYFEENGVIDSELRDLTGHRNDLRYMIGLYLAGPLDEELVLPFTKSSRLLSLEQTGDAIHITLSDLTDVMNEFEFSLACACLSLTCMNFTQCAEVTIVSGDRTIVMNADNIMLSDTPLQETHTGG